jgi:DNA-binding NtrC family response regulator
VNKRVLIIESDPGTLAVLNEHLANWLVGCDLFFVLNATQAAAKVQIANYDVIVLGTTNKDNEDGVCFKMSLLAPYSPEAAIILFSNLNLNLTKVGADEIICRSMQEGALASAIRRHLFTTHWSRPETTEKETP